MVSFFDHSFSVAFTFFLLLLRQSPGHFSSLRLFATMAHVRIIAVHAVSRPGDPTIGTFRSNASGGIVVISAEKKVFHCKDLPNARWLSPCAFEFTFDEGNHQIWTYVAAKDAFHQTGSFEDGAHRWYERV